MNKNTTKQDKSQTLLFSFNQDARPVMADFKGGNISSDGGLVLLREFDKKTSFIQGLNNCIFDPRNPFLILHEQEELLRQRLFQIAAGYEDADDADLLRHDPLFQLAVKNKKARWQLTIKELASQPTLCRLENRITLTEIEKLNNFLPDHYLAYRRANRKKATSIILDMDSTNDPTHGNQQMSMFNGYYEERVYHPLLISEPESKLILGASLRAGNVHTADKAIEHLSPIVKKLKENLPDQEIILRADSGFNSAAIYDYCQKEKLSFAIGISSNNILLEKAEPYRKKAQQIFEKINQEYTPDFSTKEFTAMTAADLCAAINRNDYKLIFTTQDNTIDRLNELLRLPSFYSLVKTNPKIILTEEEITKLAKKTASIRLKDYAKLTVGEQKQIRQLNRLLLETIYPFLCPRSQKEQPVLLYVSVRYKAESWNRQQKVVVKIEINRHETDLRFVVTNLTGKAKELYEFYAQRGDSENRIEELKNGFYADRLSCHAFLANYFRLLLHTCAFNFMTLLANNLKHTTLAEAKIDTIRLKVLKVGAWLKTSARKIMVHFSSAWPFRNLFQEIYTAIVKSPHYSWA